MSDVVAIPPLEELKAKRTPTVYFIDDSATMREVIKIAFRRESIHVITCSDAAAALNQFEQHPPDVVITDVIMPDKDGFAVCAQIKGSPQFGKTPVILMSGVVNKNVADRAVAVQADELVRKPFQPQELLGRVKSLLGQGSSQAHSPADRGAPASSSPLSNLFAPSTAILPARVTPMSTAPLPAPPMSEAKPAESVWPRALAEAFLQQANPVAPQNPAFAQPAAPRPAGTPAEAHKLRAEIVRLELLVRKLQTELQIEREYNQALEQHVRTLTRDE